MQAILDTPYWQDYHEAAPLPTSPENDVRAVAIDTTGRLWCATAAGVRFYERGRWQTPAGGAEIGECYSLVIDTRGTVWVGNWNGVFKVERGGVGQDGPSGSIITALAMDGPRILAAGPKGLWQKEENAREWKLISGRSHPAVRAVASAGPDHIWVGTGSGLYLQHRTSGAPARRLGTPDQLLSSYIYCLTPLPDGTVAVGSTGGVDFYKGTKRVGVLGVKEGLPNRHARSIAVDKENRLWIATKLGVVRYDLKSKEIRLRHSRRWLASDDARAVAVAPDGTAWVGNAGGLDAIRRKKITLAEKADYFLDILRKRHIRPPGLVGPAVLKRNGDVSESFIEDDDNDGEHTGMYMAMESLRYAVTKNPQARQNAKAAFDAMVILQEVTGTPHFIARSVLPIGTAPLHEVDRVYNKPEIARMSRDNPREKIIEKRWVPSKDGKWLWKRDASSDEIDGHLFGYAMYYDLAADESEKKRVAALVDRIMSGIVDNGFILADIDGKATQWGDWSPESLNSNPAWNEERYGNSTEIFAHLGMAYHITGKQKFVDAARLLIDKHGYAQNMSKLSYHTPAELTHINDELLSMVFPNLFKYLILPELRAPALAAIRQWHTTCKRDHIPFYDFVYNTFSGKQVPLEESVETLREWPLDMIEWTVDNRSREDVQADRRPGSEESHLSKIPPRSEMGLVMWDQDPYKAAIGRNGEREDKPTDWLLAYWMGRYWGHLK